MYKHYARYVETRKIINWRRWDAGQEHRIDYARIYPQSWEIVHDDTRLKNRQLTKIVGVSDITIFKIVSDHPWLSEYGMGTENAQKVGFDILNHQP